MRLRTQIFILFLTHLLALGLTACNRYLEPSHTSRPTSTDLSIPKATLLPSPLHTYTPVPACPSSISNNIYVINPTVYNNVNPGLELGVWEAIDVLQLALEKHYPKWAQYSWQDSEGEEHNLSEFFWNTSRSQMIGVNPRVFLVTAGLALDWQIPNENDFLNTITQSGVSLNQHYRDYAFNENIRSSYPNIGDPANYALYGFFGFEQKILIEWCDAYVKMFDESPLYLPGNDKGQQ